MRGLFSRSDLGFKFVILGCCFVWWFWLFGLSRSLWVENWEPREPNLWSLRMGTWFLLGNLSKITLTLQWDMCSWDRFFYLLFFVDSWYYLSLLGCWFYYEKMMLIGILLLPHRVFLALRWRSCLIGILRGNRVLKLPSLILSQSILQRRKKNTSSLLQFWLLMILRSLLLEKLYAGGVIHISLVPSFSCMQCLLLKTCSKFWRNCYTQLQVF